VGEGAVTPLLASPTPEAGMGCFADDLDFKFFCHGKLKMVGNNGVYASADALTCSSGTHLIRIKDVQVELSCKMDYKARKVRSGNTITEKITPP
jgi:hypothetical protein